LSAISKEKYLAFIFQNDKLIQKIIPESGPLNRFYSSLSNDALTDIVKFYGFNLERLDMENDISLLYILEKQFQTPQYEFSDPNYLLRQICGYDKPLLQSVNGVMASVNSMHGTESIDELYNWCKYKFISDKRYEEVLFHSEFDKYIVNKLISMKRKK